VARRRTHVSGRHPSYLAELLAELLPDVRYAPPDGTYLAWLDFREYGLGDDLGAFFRERARVAVHDGLVFGPPGAGHVRLNFATPRPILERMVAAMAEAATGARQ
jgi:cystathionine beta-lyase